MPALALTSKSFIFVFPSLKVCINGTEGAYPFPGVSGDAIVELGRSGGWTYIY
jgi:hypothetical protein